MDVLLVIDMQEAVFCGEISRFDADGVIARVNRMADAIRRHAGQVIFVQHEGNVEDGLLPQSAGWQILAALDVHPADGRVRKTACDAFYRTDLQDMLARLAPEQVFVMGCATDFCVDTTVRAAASRDFNVVVVADGHTTGDRPHLGAEAIIGHHNWMWENLILPGHPVRVSPASNLIVAMRR
jgi:nicotinamidase-related amidase